MTVGGGLVNAGEVGRFGAGVSLAVAVAADALVAVGDGGADAVHVFVCAFGGVDDAGGGARAVRVLVFYYS